MLTAIEAMTKVEQDAKKCLKGETTRYGTVAPGDCHRQGDVYVLALCELPPGAVKSDKALQLAPGTTQGSRHCLRQEDLSHIEFYRRPDASPLDGPILVAKNRFEVTHPEHAHVNLPPGVYAITYQRQHAEELRRVAD